MADRFATRSPGPAEPSADVDAELGTWRCRVLERSGFDHPLASALARQPALDLHDLLTLVDRGCRPDLAARILAPLDDDRQG